MKNKWTLINEVKRKGGLFALIADNLQSDEDADRFIVMCFEQCHNELAAEMWGNQLILKIVNYRLKLIRNKFNALIVVNKCKSIRGDLRTKQTLHQKN